MKKLVAVVALVASGFVVPVLPVTAASAVAAPEVNCLILPALKKECWERGAEMMKAAPKPVAMTSAAAPTTLKLPMLWTCTAAPKGSGHMFDC